MNYVVISSLGTFEFRFLKAARDAAYLTGGTCHRIYGRLENHPVYSKKALS